MSYRSFRGLGADIPTSPPTKQSELWAPPGFKYLQVDEAGNARSEYPAIVASGSVPGLGWTQAQLDAGQLQFNKQVPFGPHNFLTLQEQWSKQGFMTLYVAQYLGAPDAFLQRILTSELMKWANQPGIWIAKMPYNNPYTKAGWAPYLTQPPGPGPGPGPGPVTPECPAGTIMVNGICTNLGVPGNGGNTQPVNPLPVPPPAEKPWSFSEWYDSLSRDRKQFFVGGMIGIAAAASWWVYKTYYQEQAGSSYPLARRQSYPLARRQGSGPISPWYGGGPISPRGSGSVSYDRKPVYDAEFMDDYPALPPPPQTVYPVSKALARNGKRSKKAPVYISVPSGKADMVADAMRRMGGDLRHQGGSRTSGGRRAFSYVYLFPESKVKSAVSRAKKVGGKATKVRVDRRIKVLGDDLVKFPDGFRRNSASIPMFWVSDGGKKNRRFTAV